MSDEWPSHSEELTRKSVEHIRDQAINNANGKLSDVALWLVADTIATITQGLIPQEDWQLIYDVRQNVGLKIRSRK